MLFSLIIYPLLIIGLVAFLCRFFPRTLYQFEPPKQTVRRRELLAVVALFFALITLNNTVLRFDFTYYVNLSAVGNLQANARNILMFLTSVTLDVAFIVFAMRWFKLSFRDLGFRRGAWPHVLFWFLFVSYPIFITYYHVITGQSSLQISGPLAPPVVVGSIISLIQTVVYAPIIEEVVFRGIFLQLFRRRMSILAAFALQAVLFGFAHGFIQHPLGAIGPGLNFGLGVIGTGSIWTSIATHAFFNSTGALQEISETMARFSEL